MSDKQIEAINSIIGVLFIIVAFPLYVLYQMCKMNK